MTSDLSSKSRHKDEGHRSRLRDRFLKTGLDGFHDYEVIELLLTLGTPRKDCKVAAKAAMTKFKTFRGVMEASPRELAGVKGLGPKNTLGLQLMKAVLDRYLEKRIVRGKPLNNSRELFDYLDGKLGGRSTECFMAVFLDARNRVITSKVLFEGTLTASAVYPREVVRAAIDHHAASLILAHNHPSGDPRPSGPDMTITRRLIFACRVMDIVLHDHLIIGDQRYYSFADEGHIRRFVREMDQMDQ
jgi:DNA repair protein RadC